MLRSGEVRRDGGGEDTCGGGNVYNATRRTVLRIGVADDPPDDEDVPQHDEKVNDSGGRNENDRVKPLGARVWSLVFDCLDQRRLTTTESDRPPTFLSASCRTIG